MADIGALSPADTKLVLDTVRQLKRSGLLNRGIGEATRYEATVGIPCKQGSVGEQILPYSCVEAYGTIEENGRVYTLIRNPTSYFSLKGSYLWTNGWVPQDHVYRTCQLPPYVVGPAVSNSDMVPGYAGGPHPNFILGPRMFPVLGHRYVDGVKRALLYAPPLPSFDAQYQIEQGTRVDGAMVCTLTPITGAEGLSGPYEYSAKVYDKQNVFGALTVGHVGYCDINNGIAVAKQAPCQA